MGRPGAPRAAAPLSGQRPVVIARPGAVPPWAHRVEDRLESVDGSGPDRLRQAASVWIDGSMEQALDVARAIHRDDPTVQVGIVAADEDRVVLERRLLFTPGLGEVWLLSPEEVDEEVLGRAADVTRTRRSYRKTRQRVIDSTRGLQGLPPRGLVTDAYLAALLQVLPDPVVSVDEDDTVVTWSAAAERVLGRTAREAIGRPLPDLLETDPRDALEELLRQSRAATARRELRIGGPPPLVMDAVATPVTAEGLHVRAILLRNITSEREALRGLEEAMALRSRFFASMSHEIRTPINAILGYNDLLLSGALGTVDEAQLRHMERSQKAARHLLELVNDVLDLSKIEAGKIELRVEEVRSGDLMEELAATVQPLAEQHGTELRQECVEPGIRIRTDPRRVKQVLLNLVSNAVKFGEGRPVALRCMPEQGGIRFEVEDQGRGIAPEDQQRIFEEFAQVGAVEGGTGLGLSISRRLAELLGGTLSLDSVQGEGSTFRLRLPLEGPVQD